MTSDAFALEAIKSIEKAIAKTPAQTAAVHRGATLPGVKPTFVPFLVAWKGKVLIVREDGDGPTLARRLELNGPRPRRKDRVIATEAGAITGPEPRAALTDDDLAAGDLLAREDLDPEHLGVGFASVAA
jgi:hypothetical protein